MEEKDYVLCKQCMKPLIGHTLLNLRACKLRKDARKIREKQEKLEELECQRLMEDLARHD